MELVIAAVVILAVAAAVVAFIAGQRRSGRPPRNDPMARAVVRHSEALDPGDVVVEELRLKAQANRVAAERADNAELAAEHQARADALEQRAAQTDGRAR